MCNPFLHHVHVELQIQYNICVWLYRDDAKRKAFPTVYLSCNDNKGASLKNDLFPTYPYICA